MKTDIDNSIKNRICSKMDVLITLVGTKMLLKIICLLEELVMVAMVSVVMVTLK